MAPSAISTGEADNSWESSPIDSPVTHEASVSNGTGIAKFEKLADVKTILITGGAGFIGSWVTKHLTLQYADSYNIVVFDKMDVVSSGNNIASLLSLPNFHFVKGDITHGPSVTDALTRHKVDCVLHFAANSHVQDSFNNGVTFTYNNVIGTQVLLEAVRNYGKIQRFVHVSTDEVYGETNGVLVDEKASLLPTNPYSASKAAAEMYATAYRCSFGIPVVIVRSNNVYGPNQYPEKIIPTFISLLQRSQKLTLQGTGRNSRRYLYAADAAEAFDTILHKGSVGEAYNVGSAYEITNLEVGAALLRIFGHEVSIPRDEGDEGDEEGAETRKRLERFVEWVPDRPFNDNDYAVDDAKLRALGWRQRTGFPEGLSATVEWYQRCGSWWWGNRGSESTSASAAAASAAGAKSDGFGPLLPLNKKEEAVMRLTIGDASMAERKKKAIVMVREVVAGC